jgi:hypothetical protein
VRGQIIKFKIVIDLCKLICIFAKRKTVTNTYYVKIVEAKLLVPLPFRKLPAFHCHPYQQAIFSFDRKKQLQGCSSLK